MKIFIRLFTVLFLAIAFTTTSQAGLVGNIFPKSRTVIGVAVVGAAAASYMVKNCKTVKNRETGQPTTVCKSANIAKAESAPQEDKPSVIDEKGKKHILEGDGPDGGGGHRSGTGKPGKSEFPSDWSDEKIEGEISDIATDPSIEWIGPNRNGYMVGTGVRDGVEIQVVKDLKSGRIVTGYPTNLPRNP